MKILFKNDIFCLILSVFIIILIHIFFDKDYITRRLGLFYFYYQALYFLIIALLFFNNFLRNRLVKLNYILLGAVYGFFSGAIAFFIVNVIDFFSLKINSIEYFYKSLKSFYSDPIFSFFGTFLYPAIFLKSCFYGIYIGVFFYLIYTIKNKLIR